MFDRQLAKWHLERQGYLAAIDVQLGEFGGVDAIGIKVGKAAKENAVFGVVRGWWHAGAHLTPSLIRHHLQTDRKLLDRAFAPERLAKAVEQFGLSREPEKLLFYATRSPSKAAAAERELQQSGIRVVYLEDILAEALTQARFDENSQTTVLQVLAMVKSSRIFKEMARLARQANRASDKKAAEKVRERTETDRQLDLLLSVPAEDEGEA